MYMGLLFLFKNKMVTSESVTRLGLQTLISGRMDLKISNRFINS